MPWGGQLSRVPSRAVLGVLTCSASAACGCDFLGKESREAAELQRCAQGVGSLLQVGDADGVNPRWPADSKAELAGTAHTHDCFSLGYVLKTPVSFVFPQHSRLLRHQRGQFPEAVKPSTCLHNSTCTL